LLVPRWGMSGSHRWLLAKPATFKGRMLSYDAFSRQQEKLHVTTMKHKAAVKRAQAD